MKKRRELTLLAIHQALFAISLALPIVSAQAESRTLKTTEGELALELFGLIAEQSGCSDYAVAWRETATQQIHYRCIESVPEAQRFTATVCSEMKFLIDVSRAKAEYRRRFGNAGLSRSTPLLAYLLANFHGKVNQSHASAPVLVHVPMVQSEGSDKKD